MHHGLPTVTGFVETFWMATGFLVACLGASALVPTISRASTRRVPEGVVEAA